MPKDRKKDRFNHSPFKSLKGLPVSGAAPRPATKVPTAPEPVAEPPADGDLFAREMRWMEVRPLEGREADSASSRALPPAAVAPPVIDESSEFLAAIGQLDKRFQDEIPVEEAPQARPRRMRQLERGEIVPAGQLDLHGLTREEALTRTREFLARAVRAGWSLVLVVTGKGLRSSEGPVLRQAVERLLAEAPELVLEWGEAPRRLGGSGALAVFLRGKKPSA